MLRTPIFNLPAEILHLASVPPLMGTGKLTCTTKGDCTFILDNPLDFSSGMQVVIDSGADGLRIAGVIRRVFGNRVEVEAKQIKESDKRTFPRMQGGIVLTYHVVKDPELPSKWMKGENLQHLNWHSPDPFMDFSVSGLRFEHALICNPNDTLLLELAIPNTDNLWRAVARVVRVGEIPEEELQNYDDDELRPTHWIAVHFVELSTEAREALMAFTIQIQEAFLKP